MSNAADFLSEYFDRIADLPSATKSATIYLYRLSTYFQYSAAIRKLIYTTNTIEGFHRQVRKVTKTKGAFLSDISLLKLIYLATQNMDTALAELGFDSLPVIY